MAKAWFLLATGWAFFTPSPPSPSPSPTVVELLAAPGPANAQATPTCSRSDLPESRLLDFEAGLPLCPLSDANFAPSPPSPPESEDNIGDEGYSSSTTHAPSSFSAAALIDDFDDLETDSQTVSETESETETEPNHTTSGLNDWRCKPKPGYDPVIFLHGLGVLGPFNWLTKGALVASQGYCVFTPTYGWHILPCWTSMRRSSKEVGIFVDKVRASTGADKVNLVGHSSGTTVGAYYLKFDGGDTKVNAFVAFGPNFRGTTLLGLYRIVRAWPAGLGPLLNTICPSCYEILPDSAFLADLANGGNSVPGPTYTSIVSRRENIVLPYTSGLIDDVLDDQGQPVMNIFLQDVCPNDTVRHIFMALDPNVTNLILWALAGRRGPLPECLPFYMPGRSIDKTGKHGILRRIVISATGDGATEL